ncbi:hypothetical protein L7F22_041658 [Adiantum nelumboides]|nr:hypothetical protein [Adiantum nelumboides]
MGRAPCCEKVGLNRGPWTREEDMRLIEYIQSHGGGCWRTLPKAAGLLRCGKSCRLRWINYLRPDLKRGDISEEEDRLIIKLHSMLGNRWSLIAGRLPGRTDNEIKNYWNTHLKKKLRSMGIDPQTHAPLVVESTKPSATLTKRRLPIITNNHQPHATSTNHLSAASPITPTNHLSKHNNHHFNPDYHSFKAKPLHDMPLTSPLHLLKAVPLITESSPSYTSLLAPSLTIPKPHTFLPSSSLSTATHVATINADSDARPCSSSSLPPSSFPMECHPHFLPMLAHSHSKPKDTHVTPLASFNQSLCYKTPPSITLVGTTYSTSSSSSSSSSCVYPPSFTNTLATYPSSKDHNKSYEDLEDYKNVEVITTKHIGNMEKRIVENKRVFDIGVDCEVDEEEEASLMQDCDLSLMEGDLMWDMEMIHCFQEVGTPTTSSLPTCSSSDCNLWSHDASCCYNASPLPTWHRNFT